MKYKLLGWASKHPRYWHLRFPRAYKFVDWVIPPTPMGWDGLRLWIRYASR